MSKRILIVGHGRAGKDEAGEYLQSLTGLTFAGTTSLYLAKYVAAAKGITVEEAYANRHSDRDEWYRIGNELRANNPGVLLREAFLHGDITGGVRDAEEIEYAKEFGFVDLIVWIRNDRIPVDPTVRFTEQDCHITICNNGTLDEYHWKLRVFAEQFGLMKV